MSKFLNIIKELLGKYLNDSSENIDEDKQREILYIETKKDLFARQISNSTTYDNAILTLSSAILGLSLTFINKIVPNDQINQFCFLVLSWILFGISIVSIILSFFFSHHAINTQLEYAYKYYIEKKEEYLSKPNYWNSITSWLNLFSGICFILGIALTIYFISVNIGERTMKENKSKGSQTPSQSESQNPLEKANITPPMQPFVSPKKSQSQNNKSEKPNK